MSILSVVQDAAPKLGIARPTQLIADTGSTSLELQATLAEVAAMIRDRYDWEVFKSLGTFTGDGVVLVFNKPADYERMIVNGELWPSSSPFTPLTHITDSNLWLGMVTQSMISVVGAWTILGDQFQIRMGGSSVPLPLATTVSFYYITDKQFADNSGVAKAAISADNDVFRLDERLLKLGLIYRWKEDKGRPFAADEARFEDALAIAIGNNKGPKILHLGARRSPIAADIAWPWPVV